MNPLGMNWAESATQKMLFFLLLSSLWILDITVFKIFGDDTVGQILNLFAQMVILYVGTIWFSKLLFTFGRHIR